MKNETIGKATPFALVDSGQLLIVDPCYVLDGKQYDAACLSSDPPEDGKEHIFSPPFGSGVVFSTGGDGMYPVHVEFDSTGHPTRIVINLAQKES